MAQHDVTARCRHRAQKSACLNPIRHHAVAATVQPLYATDADARAAVAFDLCAHGDQHLGQVRDFRLLGRVLQNCLALSQGGGHQKILGAGDRDHVCGDVRAVQPRQARAQACHHITMFHCDVGTHGLQAFDVLVYGTRTNGTSAGQGHLGVAEARQQRPQRQHRCAHGFDQIVWCFRKVQSGGIQSHDPVFLNVHLHAHVADELDHGRHILQAWHVVQGDRIGTQNRRTQFRQCRVFGTRNRYLAM